MSKLARVSIDLRSGNATAEVTIGVSGVGEKDALHVLAEALENHAQRIRESLVVGYASRRGTP